MINMNAQSRSDTENSHEEYKATQMDLTHIRSHCYCKILLSMLFYSFFYSSIFWPASDDLFFSKNQNYPLVLPTSLASGLSGLHYLLSLGIANKTQLMRLQAHINPDVNQWHTKLESIRVEKLLVCLQAKWTAMNRI